MKADTYTGKIRLQNFNDQASFPVSYFTDNKSTVTYYVSAVSDTFLLKFQKPRYLRIIKNVIIQGNHLNTTGNVIIKNISSKGPL
jgi:hypothetical protein